MFAKSKKELQPIRPKDVFKKVHSIESLWLVDWVFDFPGMPEHVRLIEQGGNDRTVTVTLSQLFDTNYWTRIQPLDKKEA